MPCTKRSTPSNAPAYPLAAGRAYSRFMPTLPIKGKAASGVIISMHCRKPGIAMTATPPPLARGVFAMPPLGPENHFLIFFLSLFFKRVSMEGDWLVKNSSSSS